MKTRYYLFVMAFLATITGCTTYQTQSYDTNFSDKIQIGDIISVATTDDKYHSFTVTGVSNHHISGEKIHIEAKNIKRVTISQKTLDGKKTAKVAGYILLAVFVAGLLDFKDSKGGVTVGP